MAMQYSSLNYFKNVTTQTMRMEMVVLPVALFRLGSVVRLLETPHRVPELRIIELLRSLPQMFVGMVNSSLQTTKNVMMVILHHSMDAVLVALWRPTSTAQGCRVKHQLAPKLGVAMESLKSASKRTVMTRIEWMGTDAVQLARLNWDSSASENSVFLIVEMDGLRHFSTNNVMMPTKRMAMAVHPIAKYNKIFHA